MTGEEYLAEKLSGGCKHYASVDTGGWWCGVKYEHRPIVSVSNDDDSFYTQYFETREEIEGFISELRRVADEAWPTTKVAE